MRSFFKVLDKAGWEFGKSSKLRETYIAHANLRQQLAVSVDEWAIIEKNAKAKNISLNNDTFRENIIANLRLLNDLITAEIKVAHQNEDVAADWRLPCNIAIVKFLLTEEFATLDKQQLAQKMDVWLDYLNNASIDMTGSNAYLLIEFHGTLRFLRNQLSQQKLEEVVTQDQMQSELVANAVIEKIKKGALTPVQADAQLRLDHFPLFKKDVIAGTAFDIARDAGEKQRRLEACERCLEKLSDRIENQRKTLNLSIGTVSHLLVERKNINTKLDIDLKQYTIIHELKSKLEKSATPAEAIKQSNAIIQRRWKEITRGSNAKYSILEYLRRLFPNWITPVKPTFFAAINAIDKESPSAKRKAQRHSPTK